MNYIVAALAALLVELRGYRNMATRPTVGMILYSIIMVTAGTILGGLYARQAQLFPGCPDFLEAFGAGATVELWLNVLPGWIVGGKKPKNGSRSSKRAMSKKATDIRQDGERGFDQDLSTQDSGEVDETSRPRASWSEFWERLTP